MVTALYAVMLAGLMVFLAGQVIKQRRKARVKYADGGIQALTIARSAHGNAVDYIPISILLMALAEYNGAPLWLIHSIGVTLVIGRVIHAVAILKDKLPMRVRGMAMTFVCIAVLMVGNLVYLPWRYLW